MEVEASLILFERSLQRHNLRYTTILSDGDCRTYLALVDAEVYGFTPITKEDWVNLVKKRMGTCATCLQKVRARHLRGSVARVG
ncbi:hypothetical protein HPB48_004020 [Haemaphysalis longicornis]|uniref:Uncharacterized protein n=1 Tax=Haemaphysalis longicornis TaxID=44386 RepID=A0A9J6GGB7_HAELO|nr:hypothetical protein HPB48_004020 [Haemaphysalis longicornis]